MAEAAVGNAGQQVGPEIADFGLFHVKPFPYSAEQLARENAAGLQEEAFEGNVYLLGHVDILTRHGRNQTGSNRESWRLPVGGSLKVPPKARGYCSRTISLKQSCQNNASFHAAR